MLAQRAAPAGARTIVGVARLGAPLQTGSPTSTWEGPRVATSDTPRTSTSDASTSDASTSESPRASDGRANRTIVGMPPKATPGATQRPPIEASLTAALGTPAALRADAAPASARHGAGPSAVAVPGPQPVPGAAPARVIPPRGGATLVGVARPGIAPLTPGVAQPEPTAGPPPTPEPDPPNYTPARELGATLGADALRDVKPPPGWEEEARRKQKRRRAVNLDGVVRQKRSPLATAKKSDEPVSRRGLVIVIASFVLALVAVLVAIFWPSPPPITARARADSTGREGVELTCKTCPDGTKITVSGATTEITSGVALVPLKTALSVGENKLRVEIDRPGNGRDEAIGVTVNVGYRIRPDLAALQAERPAFQIVAEAATGTTVTIDGKKLPLASGRGVESIDVSDVCAGLANDVKTLSRQIPYVITPESGMPEQGVVNVSIGIVPLHLDAPVAILPTGALAAGAIPDPHVTTDGPSFVLAGWTMKGAEVLAAGRPITVHADGSFAQVMNVSSVGATHIEIRARMPGMAPRLAKILVRRVESIDKAAREIEGEAKLGYRELAADIAGSIGKPVQLTGELVESKKQGYQTVMLLEVGASSGCAGGGCTVRLVQGGENAAKRGDVLRVYGHVARAFSVPGRADIAEIEVDFTQKGDRK